MKSEYIRDAAKLVELQSEVERLQGENEKLKEALGEVFNTLNPGVYEQGLLWSKIKSLLRIV